MEAYLKMFLGLAAIVNPVGAIPVFITLTEKLSVEERHRAARTTAFVVGGVLCASALVGQQILEFFAIGIPSFQVGGGILLLLIAISMMYGETVEAKHTAEEAAEAAAKDDVAAVPLGVPLLAGPGAISTVILIANESRDAGARIALVFGTLLIAVVVWGTLRLAVRIGPRLGRTGVNIFTRLMGLLLAAMATEFIARGLLELFPGLR